MRRRLAAAATMLLLSAGEAAAADATAPVLTAVAADFDAGRVDAGTKVTHTYELRNTGSTPLPIVVKAACGCTATDYDPIVPAGGIGKVTAVLDTTHMRGRIEKTIDVMSNDPSARRLTLTLKAESVRALVVTPTDNPAVRGIVGALQPVDLIVRAPGDAAFVIERVESDAIVTTRVAPAEPEGTPPHRRYRVTLTPRADLTVGSHSGTLTLFTTLPSAARFAMPVTVIVAGPLVSTPPQLRLHPGGGPLAVRVRSATEQPPFRLLRAEVSDPDFTAELVRVEGEPAWDVTVRYTGKPSRHGQVNAVVKLTTDVPSQPLVLVRLSGKL